MGVRVTERIGHSQGDPARFLGRKPPGTHAEGQIAAADPLRDGVAPAVRRPSRVEDGHDRRMVQARGDPGLRQVGLHVAGIGDLVRVGNLDRHFATELLVPCQVDAPKGSFAQHPPHAVAADRFDLGPIARDVRS